jgi:hypothetical protein
MRLNDLASIRREIIVLDRSIVSKQHAILVAIGQYIAQCKGKGKSTSNNESSSYKKAIEKHHYNASEKLNYTKLYEQFTK